MFPYTQKYVSWIGEVVWSEVFVTFSRHWKLVLKMNLKQTHLKVFYFSYLFTCRTYSPSKPRIKWSYIPWCCWCKRIHRLYNLFTVFLFAKCISFISRNESDWTTEVRVESIFSSSSWTTWTIETWLDSCCILTKKVKHVKFVKAETRFLKKCWNSIKKSHKNFLYFFEENNKNSVT